MDFNWVDLILLAILAITVLFGILRGFVRQIFGILAVIIGLILAVNYYTYISNFLTQWINNRTVTHFLGFIVIFVFALFLGGILSFMLSKAIKGPLKFINHALGGGLGLLKGALICGVILFAMLVFPFDEDTLKQSLLAPSCLRVTKAVIYLIPEDLKIKFNEAYQDIVKRKGKDVREV